MSTKGSFYEGNSTVYTDANPAGPADAPMSSPDTPSAGSFFKETGGRYAAIDLADTSLAAVEANVAAAAASAAAAAASAAAATVSSGLELLRANNLSDIANVPLAKTNLGLVAVASSGSATDLTTGTLPAARLPTPSATTLGGVESIAPVAHKFLTSISTAGVPTQAQPAAADVSGLAASATTDTTNAANISSGTLPAARLPVPSATTLGGVESIAPVAHNFLTGISTAGVPAAAQPAFTDISGAVAAAQLPNPSATTLGGVESKAAVAHQFLTSISTSGVPALAQPAAADISGLAASATTDTTNAANISSGTLPAARLPAPAPTTLGGIESIAAATSKWLNSVSTLGVPSATQPTFADISGNIALSQMDSTAVTAFTPTATFTGGTGTNSTGSTGFYKQILPKLYWVTFTLVSNWSTPPTSVQITLPNSFTAAGDGVLYGSNNTTGTIVVVSISNGNTHTNNIVSGVDGSFPFSATGHSVTMTGVLANA